MIIREVHFLQNSSETFFQSFSFICGIISVLINVVYYSSTYLFNYTMHMSQTIAERHCYLKRVSPKLRNKFMCNTISSNSYYSTIRLPTTKTNIITWELCVKVVAKVLIQKTFNKIKTYNYIMYFVSLLILDCYIKLCWNIVIKCCGTKSRAYLLYSGIT